MCTVSWLRQAEGYTLLCNRDECHRRKPAGGPRVGDVRGVSFVAPIDGDHGGSWIGANQFGLALCLLNRYVHQPKPGIPSGAALLGWKRAARLGTPGDWSPNPNKNYPSRGLLLTDLLDCRRSQHVSERLNDIELDRFQPFTMLALSVEEPASLIDWTGSECTIQLDAEALMPLTSSSLKDPNVLALRRKLFAEMVTITPARVPRRGPRSQPSRIDLDLLHQFHRSHLPERGPYSVCMHRDDAATVSLSIVTVSPGAVEFLYHPKSPCLEAAAARVLIERYPAHSLAAAS